MENKYFIVNTTDRPHAGCVVQKMKEGFYCYLDRRLKSYDGMNPSRPTPVEDFGFDIIECRNFVLFRKERDSIATYKDGMPREWQGDSIFHLPILSLKRFRKGSAHKD